MQFFQLNELEELVAQLIWKWRCQNSSRSFIAHVMTCLTVDSWTNHCSCLRQSSMSRSISCHSSINMRGEGRIDGSASTERARQVKFLQSQSRTVLFLMVRSGRRAASRPCRLPHGLLAPSCSKPGYHRLCPSKHCRFRLCSPDNLYNLNRDG